MNIRPLHDRVVVKRIETEEQVRGGIIIPDTAKEKPQEAEVIAVGPGKIQEDGSRSALDVQIGDKVLVKAKLPRQDPGDQPFSARRLVDQTHPPTE